MANKGHDDGGQLAIFFSSLGQKDQGSYEQRHWRQLHCSSQPLFFCPQDLHNIKSLEARHSLAAFFLYILSYRIQEEELLVLLLELQVCIVNVWQYQGMQVFICYTYSVEQTSVVVFIHLGQNHLLTNFVKTNFPNLSIFIGLYQN